MHTKAAVLTGPFQIQTDDISVPSLTRGQIMVEILACGICTLEKRLYNGSLKIKYPLVPGHEAVAVVREIGPDDHSGLKPGDLVALDLRHRCGECYFCRKGASHQCLNRFKDSERLLGGMAEYKIIPSRQAFKLNTAKSFDQLTLTEPLATCLHSLAKANLATGDKVLIAGAGPMGLIHLMLLKRSGFFVAVSDIRKDRLDMAQKLGADMVLNASEEQVGEAICAATEGRGCEAAFIVSPGEAPYSQVLDAVRVMGKIIFYAANYPAVHLQIDTNIIHYKELTLTGTESRTEQDFLQAVELQTEGGFDLSPLISSKFPLSNVQEAFKTALEPEQLRVVLTM